MTYHDELKLVIHKYVREVYRLTKSFPRDELYGATSQFRRASLSIMLNYVEGFARQRFKNDKIYKNFLSISYGSLMESKYLAFFSLEENYIKKEDYQKLLELNDKIGRMLYKIIN